MFFNIIYNIIISIIIIFIIHNIFDYLKNTLTAPKVKDLIHKPKNEYEKINNLINSNNGNNIVNINNHDNIDNIHNIVNIDNIDNIHNIDNKDFKIDTQNIKEELKDFFNELNNKKDTTEILDYQSADNNKFMNVF